MTTRLTSFAHFLGSYACLLYATAEKEKAWLQTHLSSGLFLWFVLGRGLLQSLSLSLSFPLHHAYALQPHHIWIHPRSESHVNQTPLKQSTELIRWHPVNIHLWKFEIIFGVFGFFSRENSSILPLQDWQCQQLETRSAVHRQRPQIQTMLGPPQQWALSQFLAQDEWIHWRWCVNWWLQYEQSTCH